MKLDFFGIDKLNFVEFNITGSNSGYEKLSQESRYLQSEVFNLFAKCFENSEGLYEYFGPNKFNARNIVILQNNLQTQMGMLEQILSAHLFKSFISEMFMGKDFLEGLKRKNAEWIDDWKFYLDKLIVVNKTMLSIIDKCIEEERVLWVIGY